MKKTTEFGQNNCPSKRQVKFAPRAAKNKYAEWVFIVNPFNSEGQEELAQIIDLETCLQDARHLCSVEGRPIQNTCKNTFCLFFLNYFFQTANRKDLKQSY